MVYGEEAMQGLAEGIVKFINYGITIITILLFVEIGRLAIHLFKGPASTAGSAVAGGSGKLFGWLKGKGAVPFTKEHRERFGGIPHSKRAFELEMGELIREKEELQVMEKIKADVEVLERTHTHLQSLADTDPHGEDQIKAFGGEVHAAIDDVQKATRLWSGVKRTTFKHQQNMKVVIDYLEKDRNIAASDINKLRVQEGLILKLHQDSETTRNALVKELESLRAIVEKSLRVTPKMVPPPAPGAKGGLIFDVAAAKTELSKFKFSNVKTYADKLVELQSMDPNKGVLGVLENLILETKPLM